LEGEGYISQIQKRPQFPWKRKKYVCWRNMSRYGAKNPLYYLVAKRDENTNFFEAYAKGRKIMNTIWSLKDSSGRDVYSFNDLAHLGKSHFQNLFKENNGANIAEIIQLALLFPCFVNDETNRSLMEEVSEEELKEVLHSFQKNKSPRPDGWTIEFFLGFYDLIGKDVLVVVEESCREGHIHAPLNVTFIALIPKSDSPQHLDDFRPISLCNCIYKVVAMVIFRRIKGVLSEMISKEKFGFLEGRQIHEAIGVAQERLHSIKSRKEKGMFLKIDLSKSYDRVKWLYTCLY
jgi:hypothetical protein